MTVHKSGELTLTGTSVDLDDQRTIAGVTAIGGVLQQMGVVDATWAEGVLNGS